MNILTFDIEDWFHILDNSSTRSEHHWTKFETRLQHNLDNILGLLQDNNQKATFFCLGWIAMKYPQAIKDIVAAGHQVGTHSHLHQLVYQQSKAEFKNDLLQSIAAIEDTTGTKVSIYRSPGFSIKESCLWAFEILLEAGITIDCSVFPAVRAHGGLPGVSIAQPFKLQTPGGYLKEFPMSVYRIGPFRFVFSGGGYFRLFPYKAIELLMSRSSYTMTYFHPRDFDPDQPILEDLSMIRKMRSYYGLRGSLNKLSELIRKFPFYSLEEADKKINWDLCAEVHLDLLSSKV